MYKSAIILFFIIFVASCQKNDGAVVVEQNTETTNNYQTLSAGPLKLSIDPKVGARIASFTYEGKEILSTNRDENNWQWGSTVWTSPQSDWNWPPPLFDTATYDFAQTGEGRLHFYSPVDPRTNLQVIKSFRLAIDEARGPLATLRYQVYNRGTEPVKVGVWEITRVPFAGQTRFATGGEQRLNREDLGIALEEDQGTMLLKLDGEQPHKQKLFYDPPAPSGKYVYNTYERDGLLLVKSWRRPRTVAPGQAPLEIYLAPDDEFAELEVQGEYREIKPKDYVDLVVFWQLMPAEELEKQLNLLR